MSDPYETAGHIRRALAAITDHYDVALHPPRRGAGSGGKASKEPPPPVSVDVLDARNDAHKDLIHYTRVVLMDCLSIEGNTITTRVDAGQIRSLVKFLDVWAEHLARNNPAAAEGCAHDLAAHAEKLKGMALPDRRDWMPLGTCPLDISIDGSRDICGGQVRAHQGREPECHKCGTAGDVAWWERAMFPDVELSELVIADDLVVLLHRAFGGPPVKPSTIRQWIKRGVIPSTDQKDPQGRSLYNRKAVIEAVETRYAVAD